MIFERAGFRLLDQFQPHSEVKIKAAIGLAMLCYDTHRRGWLAVLDGYYSFANNLLRLMEETSVFELAVSHTKAAAKLWWKGALDIGAARNIVGRRIDGD